MDHKVSTFVKSVLFKLLFTFRAVRSVKIYSTLHIGSFHTNNCEDFLIEENIGASLKLIAVLDGCTMGIESVFASTLFGKILRQTSKKLYYREFTSKQSPHPKPLLKEVLKELIEETKTIKNQLGLETNELLSTLIIGVIDTTNFNAEFLAVGDGMIHVDGKTIEYEQNDKPDYLGYHLNDDFESWYQNLDQKLSVSSFNDLSICTDGIYTFKNFKNPLNQMTESEIINFLLNDCLNQKFDNFLDQKINLLLQEKNHVITDDLAIIRVKR